MELSGTPSEPVDAVTCGWRAGCDQPAVELRLHPKLGHVPICASCAARLVRHEPVPGWFTPRHAVA